MKARYDYGPVVFNLTFFLVSFSGYRETSVVKMAFQRVLTVILGGLTVMGICLCICPAWSGHELHDLIASNMEKLGDFLEGMYDMICSLKYLNKDRLILPRRIHAITDPINILANTDRICSRVLWRTREWAEEEGLWGFTYSLQEGSELEG